MPQLKNVFWVLMGRVGEGTTQTIQGHFNKWKSLKKPCLILIFLHGLFEKSDGTWGVPVGYRELNKATPLLAVTNPDAVTIIEKNSKNSQPCKVVIDSANAFFSIAIASNSQDQFAFIWQQNQYTF